VELSLPGTFVPEVSLSGTLAPWNSLTGTFAPRSENDMEPSLLEAKMSE